MVLLLIIAVIIKAVFGWQRSALIYNIQNRSPASWERHLMRVDSNGNYTGQWLFDAAILTSDSVNGKGVYVAEGFTGQDYIDYLNLVFGDAVNLDGALKKLVTTWGLYPKSAPLQIFVGIPYPNPKNMVSINGQTWSLSVPSQRLRFGKWYADEVKRRFTSRNWYNFNCGIYYHLEEAVERAGDPEFLINFNNYAHSIGLETMWVPFYDAAGAWNGSSFGFDFVSIQPRLSFLSPIDGGNLRGDRLYSTGYKTAAQGHALEYEVRSQGDSELEYWLAHQYLSVSQLTGSSHYPQVFFVGGPDIFDKVPSQNGAPTPFTWKTYQDLGNYLRGDTITNFEVQIPWIPKSLTKNLLQVNWISTFDNLNSVRLDVVDFNINNPWRGKLVVCTPSGDTSFAVRVGPDSIDVNFNSVFVPVSNIQITKGLNISVQLYRDGSDSPWPRVLSVVGGKFEQKYVASSIFGEGSSSSNPVQQLPGQHQDSVPTHSGTGGRGKLTDGKISPTGEWWWGGQVGWLLAENKFTVTIDLGTQFSVRGVRIFAYKDITASIQWPEKVGGFLGYDCSPAERGILTGCVPVASLGKVSSNLKFQNGRYNGTLTGNFGGDSYKGVNARYVTVTAQCRGWYILDEIEVFDQTGKVISNGKSYRVTPVTGEYNPSLHYAENAQVLVDGAISSDWNPYGKLNAVGLLLNNDNQFVEAIWTAPRRNPKYGFIYVTKALGSWGISVPSYVNIQWRNEKNVWTKSAKVAFLTDCGGGCPCAKYTFLSPALVTGIRGTFPAAQSWVMVTEIAVFYSPGLRDGTCPCKKGQHLPNKLQYWIVRCQSLLESTLLHNVVWVSIKTLRQAFAWYIPDSSGRNQSLILTSTKKRSSHSGDTLRRNF